MVAAVGSENDPLPSFVDVALVPLVRNSNNVTWRNLHVVEIPVINADITNFERATVPEVVRINASTVPVGTEFDLTYQTNIQLFSFENDSPDHMPITFATPGQVGFTKVAEGQWGITLRTDLPAGAPDDPFRSSFTLKVTLPGGAEGSFPVTVDQLRFDPQTGLWGEYIDGNTYFVSLD